MKMISFDDFQDKYIGKMDTPERDAFEKEVEVAVQAYKVGEALKQARKMKQLTQQQLGEKVGVKKAQISRLENGRSRKSGVVVSCILISLFSVLGHV